MSNPQNLLWIHPDTNATFFLDMEEEEFAPIVNMADSDEKKQIIRDLFARHVLATASEKADMDELRGAKVAAAIQSLQDDIAAFDAATANQRLAMQKRMMQRQLVIIRALWRLIG